MDYPYIHDPIAIEAILGFQVMATMCRSIANQVAYCWNLNVYTSFLA